MNKLEIAHGTVPSGLPPRDFILDDVREARKKKYIQIIVSQARATIPNTMSLDPSNLHENNALHPEIRGTIVLQTRNSLSKKAA